MALLAVVMVGLLLVWPTPLLDARARNLLVLGHVVLAAVLQLLLSRLGAARTEPVAASVSDVARPARVEPRSEEHTSELQSLMRISYAVFCLKKKTHTTRAKKAQQY